MADGKARLARALKVWLDVVLVAGLLAWGLIVVWVAATPLFMRPDRPADATVQVSVGRSMVLPAVPLAASSSDGSIAETHLVKARGELRFQTNDWLVHVASNGALLLTTMFSLVGIFLVREMLRAAIAGEPFAPANVRRLRQLALLLVAAGVIVPLLDYATAVLVLGRIQLTGLPLSPALPVALDPVLVGLLIYVLAAVFDYGAALEDDRSLTV